MNVSSSSSSNSNIYTTSSTKKYWCHLCKKEFSKIYIENIEIQCTYCGNTFCEELQNEDPLSENHPSHFQPYDSTTNYNNLTNINLQNQNSNNSNNNNNRNNENDLLNILHSNNNTRPRTTSSLLDMIIQYVSTRNYYEDNLENIINQIMMNDPNKYGNPPASKNSVEKLEKIIIDDEKLKSFGIENTCAVCKDEFIIGQECLLMPCQHHFHKNCLLPWLNERNSCPVCRFELPTDDEDFENRKKNRVNSNNNNSNNDIGNVLTSDVGSYTNL